MTAPSVPPSRQDEERLLNELLSIWLKEQKRGRSLSAAEVCRDRPDLAPELERRIRALSGVEGLMTREVETTAPDDCPVGDASTRSDSPSEEIHSATGAWSPPAAYPFLAPPRQPGELGRLGPYRVFKLLGAGGMGLVFQGEDEHLGRPVALKVMRPELAALGTSRQRFLREARSAAAVRHDHVTTIHQVGEDRGVPFLVMELLEGQTLERRLREPGSVPVAEALRVGRQVAEGLAAAHARGLIHRDIKPANIWLEEATGRVKLLDFGLARAADGTGGLTQSGGMVGTPGYVAPEQAAGETVDQRSDLFSLGCVLYVMLTGRPPFAGQSMVEVLRSVAVTDPPSPSAINPDVPPALAALTMRLLVKEPAGRPPSAAVVAATLADLERVEADRPATRRRGRWLPCAAVACLLFFGLGTVGVLFGPAIYRFTTDRGEVVIETDDPDVEVTVRGPEIRVLDRRTNQTITLKSGKYEAELSRGRAGLRLSTREFTLERAGKQIVKVSLPKDTPPPPKDSSVVPVRWKPGPGDSSLSGLVVRPARLPGVRRWQVTTTAPSGKTNFVAWSPDSQRLVCGGVEPYLRVYERATGRLIKVLVGHGRGGAGSGAWSPDGKQIASGGWTDGQLLLWDVEAGTCRRAIAIGFSGISMAWSPDGRNLAVASGDGRVGIWRVADGSPGPRMKGHTGDVFPVALSVCWSPDGTRVASAGRDGVSVWEAATGKPDPDFQPGNPGTILKVAWSGDGRWIAGAGPSQVTLWEAKTGRAGPSFPNARYGSPLAWNPERTQLAFCKPYSVEMWSGVAGLPPRHLTPLVGPEALAWSADGRWIALAGRGGVLRLWDAEEGKPGPTVQEPGDYFQSVSWSADGKRLATGDTGGALRIWDSRSGEPGPVHKEPASVDSVAWRPEGKELAFASGNSVQFWSGVRGESPARFGKELRGYRVVWSPDGRRLAVHGQLVELWEVAQQRRESTLNFHGGSVVWRPNGRQLASTDLPRGDVQLWNAADGKMDQILKGVTGCSAIAWSRDGNHLACIGHNGLYIWNENRKPGIPVPVGGGSVAWSPRENILAYGGWGGQVGVCGADEKIRHEFQAHHAIVSALCWDPQGRFVASCSNDGTLSAWDATSGQPLWQAVLLAGGKTATFSPAGELLHADSGAEKHLVYLVERTAGKVELLTAEDFKHLLETSPPEKSEVPVRGTEE